jgi:ribosomal protein L16 Arg81 hydroxylase
MTAHTIPPPATLNELVAPLTETEFLALLRERTLTLQKAPSSDRFKALLSWDRLLELLEQGQYPRGLGEVRVAKESTNVGAEKWLRRDGADNSVKIDTAKVRDYVTQGHSLIVTPIHPYVPCLSALCDSIKARVAEQIKVGVIVTTGTGGAFRLHFDPEDLIILQIEGTKRWRVFGPPVSNPVIGMPAQTPPPETEPLLDEVLRPGDLLFLPAGYWHHCQNGLGRSLHLGIFFIPPTGWNVAKNIAAGLVSDEVLRRPFSRLDEADRALLEEEIKARLVERIGQLKLGDFLAEWPQKPNV